jgi:hypothetical protein
MWRYPKITQKHIDLAYEYLDSCWEDYDILKKSETDKGESFENVLMVNLPTFVWLLNFYTKKARDEKLEDFRIWTSTLNDWLVRANDDEKNDIKDKINYKLLFVKFSEVCEEIKRKQEEMLVNWGISWRYSSQIAKLMLSSNHGYKETEKKEVDVTVIDNIEIK